MFNFMKRKIKEEVENQEIVKDEESTINSVVKFSVFKDDVFIRSYDLITHGEDAEKLANQFASKIGGEVR